MRTPTVLTAVALALGACQTAPPKDFVQFHAGQDATTVAKHLASKVSACWFDGKHDVFEGHSYAPEQDVSSTRILIVPKVGPRNPPAVLVEVIKAKRGTDVRLSGLLMDTKDAETIRNDILSWTGGGRDC